MEILKSIISTSETIKSYTMLHVITFIAQKFNLIPQVYDFDYSLNLPFSEALEKDYLLLREEGFIIENEEGLIEVDAEQKKPLKEMFSKEQAAEIKKLSSLDLKTLIDISRLMYLCEKYPETCKDRFMLEEKARHTFFITSQTFKRVFEQFINIKSNIVFGEV